MNPKCLILVNEAQQNWPLRLSQFSLASPAHTHTPHSIPLLCSNSPGFLEGLSSTSSPSLSSFAFAVPNTQEAFFLEPSSSLRSQFLMKTLYLIDSNKPVAIASPYFNCLQSTSHCYFSFICFVGLAVLDKLSFPQNLNSDKRYHAIFSLQDISQPPTDPQAQSGLGPQSRGSPWAPNQQVPFAPAREKAQTRNSTSHHPSN